MKTFKIKREKLNIKSDWDSDVYILYPDERVIVPFTTVKNTYGLESIVVLKENIRNIKGKENQTITFDINCWLLNSTSEHNLTITIHNKTTNEDLTDLSFKLQNGFETQMDEKFKNIDLLANTTYNIILSSSITDQEKIEISGIEVFLINKFHQIKSSMVINDATYKPTEGINPSLLQIEKNKDNINANTLNIGDLTNLKTHRKANLVNSINEVYNNDYYLYDNHIVSYVLNYGETKRIPLQLNRIYIISVNYRDLGYHNNFTAMTGSAKNGEVVFEMPISQANGNYYKGYCYFQYELAGNSLNMAIHNHVANSNLRVKIYELKIGKNSLLFKKDL